MKNPRSHFPFFKVHPAMVYLDNASTTQRVDSALEAEFSSSVECNANVHRGLYPLAEASTERYEAVREIGRRFLNAASAKEIVFTHGTTEGLNIVAQAWGRSHLKAGDEVLLSTMEHHSNLVPWQMVAKATGAKLKFIPLTAKGDLDYSALEKMVNKRTRLVSITGLSNVLGTRVDLKKIVKAARAVKALVCVDAAQLAAHEAIDVQKLDVDFLAFSSHKLYGPTGAGILYGKQALLESMSPWMGGGDMIRSVQLESSEWNEVPYKFEAGTPNIAGVIGMGAALEFMMEQGWQDIEAQEEVCMKALLEGLKALPFVTVYGTKKWPLHRGAVSFNVKGVHAHDTAAVLGEIGICVRAGHHCTMPLHSLLKTAATVRASVGIYTTPKDIAALLKGLKKVAQLFA